MGTFVKGDIVILPFPFSDLSKNKRRPALVVANITGSNVILCQITSKQPKNSKYSIAFEVNDVNPNDGSIKQKSYIKADMVFTAASSIIVRKAGKLSKDKQGEVSKILISLFK